MFMKKVAALLGMSSNCSGKKQIRVVYSMGWFYVEVRSTKWPYFWKGHGSYVTEGLAKTAAKVLQEGPEEGSIVWVSEEG